MSDQPHLENPEIPRGNAMGFVKYFDKDLLSGFLVFLIALPLCLGISLACGFPAIAGVFTAIIGSIVTTFVSNSELTIKGPAAGLIVVAIGAIEEFGGDGMIGGFTRADMTAYRYVLAVGVTAAIIQIVLGMFRAGVLGEFFPLSAVHGMLAAIGVIIIAKQFPVALGVSAKGNPLELLANIPTIITQMNPVIGFIGGLSILIMFTWPVIRRWNRLLGAIPGPLVVLVVTIPLGMYFNLTVDHAYTFRGTEFSIGQQHLVAMPNRMFGMFDDITFPDFSVLMTPIAWKWVAMFAVIGSLESVLSAKAVDLIDPWRRKTNLDRDLLAVGVGNLLSASVGGLPMISEIVRSRANIDNGARTRFADLWHGVFLLACVALIPAHLHRIPLAALAGMLVYTGFRLAHPKEFQHVYQVGKEQLVVFVATIVGVLATDLLIGIAIGIAVEFLIGLINGASLKNLFWTRVEIEDRPDQLSIVHAHGPAVFSNWLHLRQKLLHLSLHQKRNVILDLSRTSLVDHSVMKKLLEMKNDLHDVGIELTLTGLDQHRRFSNDQSSACKRTAKPMVA